MAASRGRTDGSVATILTFPLTQKGRPRTGAPLLTRPVSSRPAMMAAGRICEEDLMTAQQIFLGDTATSEECRRIGLVFMLASAVVFSTAGLFTKGTTADAWSIIFWRGLVAATVAASYARWKGRGAQESGEMGRSGLAVAVLGALGTAAFIPAFKLTTIANVSLIYAARPLVQPQLPGSGSVKPWSAGC